MTRLSFRELSALGSAMAVALMGWLYFSDALRLTSAYVKGLADGLEKGHLIRFAVGIIVLLVVIEIAWHIMLKVWLREEADEPADERDRLVQLKAQYGSGLFLQFGIVILTGHIFINETPGLLAAQYFLLLFFASEFIRYSAKFLYYRIGV